MAAASECASTFPEIALAKRDLQSVCEACNLPCIYTAIHYNFVLLYITSNGACTFSREPDSLALSRIFNQTLFGGEKK